MGAAMIVDVPHARVAGPHRAGDAGQRPAGMPLRFDGTLSGLLRTMDEAGIDKGMRPRRRHQGVDGRPHQRVHRYRAARPARPRWAPCTPT